MKAVGLLLLLMACLACDDAETDAPTPAALDAAIDQAIIEPDAQLDATVDAVAAPDLATLDAGLLDATPVIDGGPDAQPAPDAAPPLDYGPPPPPQIDPFPRDAEGCHFIFRQDHVPHFELIFDPAELALLEADQALGPERLAADIDPNPYRRLRAFRYGQMELRDLWVRLRGNPLFWAGHGKMQMQIAFDRADNDGRFLGLRTLLFDAASANRTYLRDRLALSILRSAGVPAPCANNATLSINGAPYGLFTSIEKLDDLFLERTMPDPSGDLWRRGSWELKTNEDTSDRARMDALRDAEDLPSLATLLDIDQALDFWALDALLSNADGAWAGGLNFYLYDDPISERFLHIPWDLDSAFTRIDSRADFLTYVKPTRFNGRPWFDLVVADPAHFQRWLDALERGLDGVFEPARLIPLIDTWNAQIAPAVRADPNRPFDLDLHRKRTDVMRAHIWDRARFARRWIHCWRTGTDDGEGNCVPSPAAPPFVAAPRPVDPGPRPALDDALCADRRCAPEWARVFAGEGAQAVRAVVALEGGDLVALLDFEVSADFGDGVEPARSADVALARYDGAGRLRWLRVLGDASLDFGADLSLAPDGDLLVALRLYGALPLPGPWLLSGGLDDSVALRLSPEGQLRWAQIFRGPERDRPTRIRPGPAGAVLLTGCFSAAVDFAGAQRTSAGETDGYLAWLDGATGDLRSLNILGGPGPDCVDAVGVGPQGVLAVGTISAGARLDGGAPLAVAGDTDLAVMHFTDGGELISAAAHGGAGSELAEAIEPYGDGFAIAGYATGAAQFGPHAVRGAGGLDLLLLEVNGAGAPQRARVFGDAADQRGDRFLDSMRLDLARDAAGGLWLAGAFVGAARFDDVELVSDADSLDAFVVRFGVDGRVDRGLRMGGTASEMAQSIVALPNGSVVLGGRFHGRSFDPGPARLEGPGGGEGYLARRRIEP